MTKLTRKYIKEMRLLLKTAYYYLKDGKSNGCYHLPLEDGLFLVAAYDADEGEVIAKVAYNDSSTQCDYDLDWSFPVFENDGYGCCFVECVINDKQFRECAEYFYAEAKAMIRLRKHGLVKDWRI